VRDFVAYDAFVVAGGIWRESVGSQAEGALHGDALAEAWHLMGVRVGGGGWAVGVRKRGWDGAVFVAIVVVNRIVIIIIIRIIIIIINIITWWLTSAPPLIRILHISSWPPAAAALSYTHHMSRSNNAMQQNPGVQPTTKSGCSRFPPILCF